MKCIYSDCNNEVKLEGLCLDCHPLVTQYKMVNGKQVLKVICRIIAGGEYITLSANE